MVLNMTFNHVEMKTRWVRLGISQEQVAQAAGYDPTLFSRYLRGLRKPPSDFDQKVNEALDRMEAAENAAAEARARVMAQGEAK